MLSSQPNKFLNSLLLVISYFPFTAVASCNMALLSTAQILCMPKPGKRGLNVFTVEDATASSSTPVSTAIERAAAKSVRELLVSGVSVVYAIGTTEDAGG